MLLFPQVLKWKEIYLLLTCHRNLRHYIITKLFFKNLSELERGSKGTERI